TQDLSQPTAIPLLGLPQAELAGRQQRLAHRPHPGDCAPRRALHEVRRGCRTAAGSDRVRPHLLVGGIRNFHGLTFSACIYRSTMVAWGCASSAKGVWRWSAEKEGPQRECALQ